MANIFPKWTVTLPIKLAVMGLSLGAVVFTAAVYYLTPKYSRVGYNPVQPIAFEHSLHATQLGIDCRYCHQSVEISATSSVPSVQTCMTCHSQVKKGSLKLQALYDAWNNGKADGPAVHWVRIHQEPDFAYFNHSIHVNSGISCVSCHGNVNHMQTVSQKEPQSMSWCLDCHRHPEAKIRPLNKVYDLDWKAHHAWLEKEPGEDLVKQLNINPPQTCSGCHR